MPKIVVIYPYPPDVEKFEHEYMNEHIPMARENIQGMSKFILTRVLSTADGSQPPFYRIAELHFPSMEALQATAASEGMQKAAAHAVSISSGGPPHFLVAEEEVTEV